MTRNILSEILRTPSEEKGQINKIIDVLIPREIIERNINFLLVDKTPRSLKMLIDINFIVKSYLIYIVSNIESLIDTWAQIESRQNKFFDSRLKDLTEEDLIGNLFQSKRKFNDYKYSKEISKNTSIKEQIANGTLGTKIHILKLFPEEKVKWLYSTKSNKLVSKTMNKESFMDRLITSKEIRNSITHNAFILEPEFWEKIYRKTINKRKNQIKLPTRENMIKELFKELEDILKIADYGQLRNRIIKHISRELNDKGYNITEARKNLNLGFLLNK